jgi:hypothetical protein
MNTPAPTKPSAYTQTIADAIAAHQQELAKHIRREGAKTVIDDQHWSRLSGGDPAQAKNAAAEIEAAMNKHHSDVHETLINTKEEVKKGLAGKSKEEIRTALRDLDTEAAKVLKNHAADVEHFRGHLNLEKNAFGQKYAFKEPTKLFQVDASLTEKVGANWKHAKVRTGIGAVAVAGALVHAASELLAGGEVDPETKEKTGPRLGVIAVDGLVAAGGAWAMLHGGRGNFAKGLAG